MPEATTPRAEWAVSFYEAVAAIVAVSGVALLLVVWQFTRWHEERENNRALIRRLRSPRHVHSWVKVEESHGRVLVQCATCKERQWFQEGVSD